MPAIDDLINNAITSGLFPGCALIVWSGPDVVLNKAWGRLTFAPWSPRVSCKHTYFDLASLTKPIATACSIMTLASQGRLGLDTTIADILADVPDDKAGITTRQLLSHTSGLAAHRPFYIKWMKETKSGSPPDTNTIINSILKTSLEYVPGTRSVYSDLGFMLLSCMAEKITGMKFQDIVNISVFEPLSSTDIKGAPHIKNSTPLNRIAPTGICPFEHRIIQGETNDLNARAAGGLMGHAGLFGTAEAVSDLLARLVQIYHGAIEIKNFSRAVLKKFWTKDDKTPQSTWALGFDTPSCENSSAGHHFSEKSVGHLGFTGTSFWIDLEKHIIVVFLANRTFPRATQQGQEAMKMFRPILHDTIMKSLGPTP